MMRVAVGVVSGRMAYLDCRDELLPYYARQGYEPLFYDELKGLHKLAKALV